MIGSWYKNIILDRKMTNFEMVKEFNRKFKLDFKEEPTRPEDIDSIELGLNLITEECDELTEEHDQLVSEHFAISRGILAEHDYTELRNKLAKETADLLYVVYGYADRLGIPIDEVFAEVHRSNMSKLDKDGNPTYNEQGKLLKPDNYSPADPGKIMDGE